MDYSQKNSVFMPGLTARGPVYSGMGDLPTLSQPVKFGVIAALLFLGVKKKIPLWAAGAGALAIWQFLPTASTAAPVTTTASPDLSTPPSFDPNSVPMPTMPPIGS